jgi:hypothetical protein
MIDRTTLSAAILAIMIPAGSFAEPEPTEFRSPGDMTVEERTAMMSTASKYDNCVYSQAIARIDDFSDIRQTADFAMTECQGKLTDLETTITGMGFGPDFATAFRNRVRNRAAHKLIPELAIRKSGG